MQIQLFQELEKASNILIAGAGGGFDVFCGLPLYFYLKNAGKTVHLASIHLEPVFGQDQNRICPVLYKILPNMRISPAMFYFPEQHLSNYLSAKYGETPIYTFEQSPPLAIAAAYHCLNQTLKADTIILVDGGTDILMRGDEEGLGTPYEDIGSLNAVNELQNVERKFVVSIGFGIDKFHGVCHAHFLENAAALIKSNGYLGCFSLTQEMAEYKQYLEAYQHVENAIKNYPSIVNTSINAAISGEYGDYHATPRTKGSKLYINPLMAIYWAFKLENVAANNYYLPHITASDSLFNFMQIVNMARSLLPNIRKRQIIDA